MYFFLPLGSQLDRRGAFTAKIETTEVADRQNLLDVYMVYLFT